MLLNVVLVVVGILIGVVGTRTFFMPRTIGTLRIDHSDPSDQPYMFLELSKGVGDISNDRYVTLEVSTENYISQE